MPQRILIDIPLLFAYADDYILPTSQSVTNAAIIVIFAYLVALLTMEINYFRLAIYRNWRIAVSRLPKKDNNNSKHGAIGGANNREKKKHKATTQPLQGRTEARGDNYDVGTLISKFDTSNALLPLQQHRGNTTTNHDIRRLDTIQSANNKNATAINGDYDNNFIGMSLSSSFSTGDYDQGEELAAEDEYCLDHSHNDNHETNLNNNRICHHNRDDEMIMIIDDTHDADADTNNNDATNKLLLRRTQLYQCIRHASTEAILSSMFIYILTAWGVGYSTVGLDSKVIAIIAGGSQFVTAVMIVIMSAKIPQWVCTKIYTMYDILSSDSLLYFHFKSHSHSHTSNLTPNHNTLGHYALNNDSKIGVYHQGSIRLVKCSSNYSQRFIKSNLNDPAMICTLRNNVRLGIWFHFAKFYILLMPFYCGIQASTIPVSYNIGLFCGFVLMWVVFCESNIYSITIFDMP